MILREKFEKRKAVLLKEYSPALFAELHTAKNIEDAICLEDISYGSNKKVWWQCQKNITHYWLSSVKSRTLANGNCSMCRSLYIVNGINDLSTTNPDLYNQLDHGKNMIYGIDSTRLAPSSNKKVWWKCSENPLHSWATSVNSRDNNQNGCGVCSNSVVISGVNDISVSHPEIFNQLHINMNEKFSIETSNLAFGTKKKVWWKCDKFPHHYWLSSVSDRTGKGNGCAMCSGHYIVTGVNDLSVTNPEIYNQLHQVMNARENIDSTKLSSFTHTKLWWKCNKDGSHYWLDSVGHRAGSRGCAMCAGKYVVHGVNDISIKNPILYSEIHPTKNLDLDTKRISVNSNKSIWWICRFKHEWQAPPYARNNGNGCPYCGNKKILVGFNDLLTTNPLLAAEWNFLRNKKLRPDQFSAGSSIKVWWICKDNHEWEAIISNRNNGHCCPKCSDAQTSKIQQVFHKAFTTKIPDLQCDTRIPVPFKSRKSMSVDMISIASNVVIEYDGEYYHSGKRSGKGLQHHLDHDSTKTQALLDAGYGVVRIRENGLQHLDMTHERLMQISYKNGDLMDSVVDEICEWSISGS